MATASCATRPTFIAVSVIRFILIYNVACLQMSLLRECSPSCISDQNRPTLTIDCTITTSLMCFVDISRYITITNRRAPALPVSNINFVCQSEYKILFKDSVMPSSHKDVPDAHLTFKGPCIVSIKYLAPLARRMKIKSIIIHEGASLTMTDNGVRISESITNHFQHVQLFEVRNTNLKLKMTGFPKLFTAFKWLGMKTLLLSNLGIQQLPPNLTQTMPNLVRLGLAKNQMTKPPPSFPWIGRFHGQTSITLAHNRIWDMPDYEFKSITLDINLEGNNLQRIGEKAFQQSPLLTNIYLGRNKLSHLPSTIFRNLRNLQKLYLEFNSLSKLHNNTFNDLENLHYLNLDGNLLTTIQTGLFSKLESLRVLHLNNNKITIIQPDSLPQHADYLSQILLKYNRIKEIPHQVFRPGFVGLSGPVVDLSYNIISSSSFVSALQFLSFNLPDTIASEIKKNERLGKPISPVLLDIKGNTISQLYWPEKGVGSFKHTLMELFQFDLSFNPLECGCDAFFFVQELNATFMSPPKHWQISKQRVKDNWKCSFPPSLKGYGVLQIPRNAFQCKESIDFCPPRCKCWKRAVDSVVTVDCIKKDFVKMPLRMPRSKKLVLLMQNNSIRSVGPQPYLERISSLRLSFNRIIDIKSQVFDIMPNHTELYLDNNLLQELPKTIRNVRFNSLSLGNNLIPCNCNSTWIKSWIKESESNIIDKDKILCASGRAVGYPISSVPHVDFVCKDDLNITKPLIPIVINKDVPITYNVLPVAAYISSGLLLIILILFILILKYRREIKLLMFAHLHVHPFDRVDDKDPRHKKIYDAFVSYSKHDEQWVSEVLREKLENNEPPYKLCIHYRDFTVGAPIQENILTSVQESRRTILLLSRNFIQSEWCMLEFRAAHHKVLQNRAIYLIIIQLDDVNINELDDELKLYMRTNTYLSVNDRWFWRKLLYSLPQLPTA